MSQHRDLVVIGASAGGIQAVQALLASLPAGLPAAIFVVLHIPATGSGFLPMVLGRNVALPVQHADDEAPIQVGRVYVARGDHHLLIEPGRMRVVHGPRENGFRPGVDPLFRSAADSYRAQTIGIILSGSLDDGTAGLMRIKKQGGLAMAQDPQEAPFPGMPTSALRYVQVDHVAPVVAMAPLLVQLTGQPLPPGAPGMVEPNNHEPDAAEIGTAGLRTGEMNGHPSGFVCPDCGGALWETDDQGLLRYRCHSGHAYSGESLMTEQDGQLDQALWAALRALEESAALRKKLASRARTGGLGAMEARFTEQAREAEDRADTVRRLLTSSRAAGDHPEQPTSAHRDKTGEATAAEDDR